MSKTPLPQQSDSIPREVVRRRTEKYYYALHALALEMVTMDEIVVDLVEMHTVVTIYARQLERLAEHLANHMADEHIVP